MKTVTLFESNLTSVDYAFIEPKTYLINGGSLNLDVEVTTGKDSSEMGSFDTVKGACIKFKDFNNVVCI